MTLNGNLISGVADDCYTKPVGISDPRKIPDNQMTASSQYNHGYQAAYGRLNGDRGDGWCAKEAGKNDDWLQVDLGKTIALCAIATQGDRNGNEWVTAFKLSSSSDAQTWTPYKDANDMEVVRSVLVFNKNYKTYNFNSVTITITYIFKKERRNSERVNPP